MRESNDRLWRMLKARRVAVVGASQDPTKFSAILLQSIISGGYEGELFPVNPRAERVGGLQCYASLSDIPGTLDLVIVIVPAASVPAVLREAADKGVAGAFVISAGFRESGNHDLEDEIVGIARRHGMRLFGPNIQGVAYAPNRLSALFWPVVTLPGPLAVLGQSGTVVAALADWALDEGLGISAAISLGNQADVCESDLLRLLQDDDHTQSIALYLEGVGSGERFVSALKDVALCKPVVVLKCGRSQLGRDAVASHTGSLAGPDRVFDGVCRQFGVIRAADTEALYDASKILATMPLPADNRVLMMSSSGGSCALAADEADLNGLVLPVLPISMVAELKRLGVPGWGSFANPLDLAGVSLDHFRAAVRSADAANLADVILLVFGDPIPGAADLAIELSAESNAAICAVNFGGGAVGKAESYKMQRANVPVFPTSERAMRAIAASCWYADRRRGQQGGK